ncbi:MAG: hypothetical protein ACJARL_000517 [Halopseudomonas sp.]|jgi:hypothetical protein
MIYRFTQDQSSLHNMFAAINFRSDKYLVR